VLQLLHHSTADYASIMLTECVCVVQSVAHEAMHTLSLLCVTSVTSGHITIEDSVAVAAVAVDCYSVAVAVIVVPLSISHYQMQLLQHQMMHC
jgi:hypothetical protein